MLLQVVCLYSCICICVFCVISQGCEPVADAEAARDPV